MSRGGRPARPEERSARGRWAEAVARDYLLGKGFALLATNQRLARGELDIIGREGETIVFVEVRSRRRGSAYSPEASLSRRKQSRLIGAARAWLARHGLSNATCRFDLISIRSGLGEAEIRHYRGAFVDDF